MEGGRAKQETKPRWHEVPEGSVYGLCMLGLHLVPAL